MIVLYALSLIGIIGGFIALTLSIASGLYYLSELVEEHTTFTKRCIERTILATIAVHVALVLFDKFPFWLSVISIATQLIYRQNLITFPYIQLSSPTFLLSCALMLLNHYLWFSHFSNLSDQAKYVYDPYTQINLPSFSQISSFFGLVIWLVPFSLFISLTAGENVLPAASDGSAVGESKAHRSTLVKVIIDRLKEYFQFLTGNRDYGGML
ncbi:hypothetical protein CANCADRAFT_73676 [Tortispora caseinolytica NRRL Y-17796]|uniref:Protein SVP26 n=1 Tax=Tortispora caseinolytica NRRL Y-17796 TaxID=767744 RepID=A0A1E4TIR7_9ASCO|nr:hypothetical protein CANCADRAFT_73676 [Tortispora caseinolytica NRRL Y-17796]